MDAVLVILWLFYVATIVLSIITEKKQQKLIRDCLDFSSKLVIERSKIVQIIIESKINKENYFVTLEKIEKVLAEDN